MQSGSCSKNFTEYAKLPAPKIKALKSSYRAGSPHLEMSDFRTGLDELKNYCKQNAGVVN